MVIDKVNPFPGLKVLQALKLLSGLYTDWKIFSLYLFSGYCEDWLF